MCKLSLSVSQSIVIIISLASHVISIFCAVVVFLLCRSTTRRRDQQQNKTKKKVGRKKLYSWLIGKANNNRVCIWNRFFECNNAARRSTTEEEWDDDDGGKKMFICKRAEDQHSESKGGRENAAQRRTYKRREDLLSKKKNIRLGAREWEERNWLSCRHRETWSAANRSRRTACAHSRIQVHQLNGISWHDNERWFCTIFNSGGCNNIIIIGALLRLVDHDKRFKAREKWGVNMKFDLLSRVTRKSIREKREAKRWSEELLCKWTVQDV